SAKGQALALLAASVMAAMLSVIMIGSCLASRSGAGILCRPEVAPSMPEKPLSGKIIANRGHQAGAGAAPGCTG
ncbi:MAG: hypothetical protein VX425_07200, partial [Pseudomonadota bacterium]|nr:hypothetical protein [Pseudomonadota bacterium]